MATDPNNTEFPETQNKTTVIEENTAELVVVPALPYNAIPSAPSYMHGQDPAYPPSELAPPPYQNINAEPPPLYPGPNADAVYLPPYAATGNQAQWNNTPATCYPQEIPQPPQPTIVYATPNSHPSPPEVTIVRNVQTVSGNKPENYLVTSVLTTFFCCCLLGIVAIVKSSQVNSFWAQGRYDESRLASKQAAQWNVAAVICGIIIIVINVLIRSGVFL